MSLIANGCWMFPILIQTNTANPCDALGQEYSERDAGIQAIVKKFRKLALIFVSQNASKTDRLASCF